MLRFCLALTILLFTAVSVLGQEKPPLNKLPSELDADLQKKVDDYIDPLIKCGLFNGAVLIARDGKVVVHKAYGKSDFENDRAFELGSRTKLMSVTKSVTATALMTLVEEGKLSLKDPASNFLPNFPEAWNEVKLTQLLSHSSGIPNCESTWAQMVMQRGSRGIELWPELATNIASRELEPIPMGHSRYSNFNYILLGLIIENVSGTTYPDFVSDRIYKPADMTESGFANGESFDELAVGYFPGQRGVPRSTPSNMSRIQAAGGMYSTVADLFRFDRALRDNKVINEKTRDEMLKPQTLGFAHGWAIQPVQGHRCVSHSGGNNGYVADFLRFPNDNACVIVTSNFALSPITMISHDLAGLLFKKGVEPVAVPDQRQLENVAGVFTVDGDAGRRVIFRSNTKTLMVFEFNLRDSNSFGRLLIPRKGNVFQAPMGGTRYKFTVDPDPEKIELTIVRGKIELATKRQNISQTVWKSMIGNYDSDFGSTVSVSQQENDSNLQFSNPGQYPAALTFIPLSDKKGLAIRVEVFGTFVDIVGTDDSPSKIESFTWHNVDGSKREFIRTEQPPKK